MEDAPMIYKSNALVEAAYRLSVQEQRILLACISQVRRDEAVTDEVLYSVRAADIAKLSGTAVEAAYSELKAAALRLKRREVRLLEEPNGKGKKPSVLITGWVQSIIYREGEGRVALRFSKDMLPYLTELTRQFTKYALADVAKMDSAYGIRLYELLMQWGSQGHREIEVSQLREWLQLEGRYPLMAELRRCVIEPAVAQINEHSPLQASFEPRKTGRKITHLAFTFAPKEAAKKLQKLAAPPAEKPQKPRKPKAKTAAPAGGDDVPGYAAALAKRAGLTPAQVARKARPGETWEQAATRLARAASAAQAA